MNQKIIGYIVQGRFIGIAGDFPEPMLNRDVLCFSGGQEVTLFSTRRVAHRAILRTIKERLALFGKNDMAFHIARVYGGG